MNEPVPALVVVDWGTTRLRAALLGSDGVVLARTESDDGVQSVAPGGFPDALAKACGPWTSWHADLPVVMSGMVGSRNGWAEAPYVACPCGVEDLAARLFRVEGEGRVSIVPGVDVRWPDGAYDVMRGEEVQLFGAGVREGMLCLPGTHSKWVEMDGGRLVRFATFITGELYAAMTASFVGRLASEPETPAQGLAAGAAVATLAGGLGRLLFQARAQVLGGALGGGAVRSFLSSLIVGQEVAGAESLFGRLRRVHLVAGSPQCEIYAAALAARGIETVIVDPVSAGIEGVRRVAEAAR